MNLLTLIQRTSYLSVDGRALTFYAQADPWPVGLNGAVLVITPVDCPCGVALPTLNIAGSYNPAVAQANAAFVEFDLDSDDTEQLTAGIRNYVYEVLALTANGNRMTLQRGQISVLSSAI